MLNNRAELWKAYEKHYNKFLIWTTYNVRINWIIFIFQALQPLQNLLSSDWSAYNQDVDGSISEQIDDICGLPDRVSMKQELP